MQEGNGVRVIETASQALELTEASGDVEALTWVAPALAQTGQFEQALKVTETISDEAFRAKALSRIVSRMIWAGQLENAREATVAIRNEVHKLEALTEVAHTLAQEGKPVEARQIVAEAFITARLGRRQLVLNAIEKSAETLVAMDQGKILWQIYEVMMEIDGWWAK